jgi:hypothetical protein
MHRDSESPLAGARAALSKRGGAPGASATPGTHTPNSVHIATVESFLHFKGISTNAAENPAVHGLLSRVLRSAGKAGGFQCWCPRLCLFVCVWGGAFKLPRGRSGTGSWAEASRVW